ncbi:MAG: 50S ribosomal protein L22 [bacterium]
MAEVKAIAKYVRVTPNKVRRIANLIQRKSYQDALDILTYVPSPNAALVKKVLESAGANAEENHNLAKDSLYVASAVVDEGATWKRFRAGSMGRAMRRRRRTSHIKVILTDKLEKKKRR